jgi:Cofilin/tropomyosin-type actin-binding protein
LLTVYDGVDLSAIRSPDGAKIKNKMVFASSKDALRRSLVGIATEIQGTDFDEIAYETGMSLCIAWDSFDPKAVSYFFFSPLFVVLDKVTRLA